MPLRPRHLALVAALLSYAWWRLVLGARPRTIDATMYWLQARALAHGAPTWNPPGPRTSYLGRFLLADAQGGIGGIFPQGYPLALAPARLVGAPWITGCALAAGLVLVTAALATELTVEDAPSRARTRILAATLSTFCAALRFHTAETMSHGLTALALTAALWSSLRFARTGSRHAAALAGLALGAIATTRPVSALAVAVVSTWVLCARRDLRGVLVGALGALPGVCLHLATQHALTGRWGAATQSVYYALSDGPIGCFRWGFGAGVGCRVEHGDFVAQHMPRGYGVVEALGVTGRRLVAHAGDVANVVPLALAVPWALASRWRERGTRAALAVVAGHVAAYAPFYFDGNLTVGGARMFADVLPVEHAVVAVALAKAPRRMTAGFVALVLFGGGYRMVADARTLAASHDHGVTAFAINTPRAGLVLVDDDRAFNTLHDPTALDPRRSVVVARHKGDAHDIVLHRRLGQPLTWQLHDDGTLVPWRDDGATTLWFRGAGLWPPRAQSGGYAQPRHDGSLVVHVTHTTATVRVEVPVPEAGRWCARAVFAGRRAETQCAQDEDVVSVTVTTTQDAVLRGVQLAPSGDAKELVRLEAEAPHGPREAPGDGALGVARAVGAVHGLHEAVLHRE